ncbi:MAG: hypothetical protein OXU66_13895 [Gammaproteobacteria bacterium]|nr:hypothetical protein [Gammaproteobacteria bacterium]MDD9895636.1 hypothetical protein [Gammaproteobacteria bacterium]MDD9960008.1 hypothetical protein [Gammaproteobacteria bacterium]
MKKICILILFVAIPVFAAEEGSSWTCEGVSSIGFYWRDGSWENQAFAPTNYLFTVGADRGGTLIFSGYQWTFDNCVSSNIVRCSTNVGNAIVMNLSTGEGAVSSIIATAVPPEGEEAQTFMERVQCTRVGD